MTVRGRILWLEGIIPLTVESISDEVKSVEFFIGHFDAGRIDMAILHSGHRRDHSKTGTDLHLSATSSSSEQRAVNLPAPVLEWSPLTGLTILFRAKPTLSSEVPPLARSLERSKAS